MSYYTPFTVSSYVSKPGMKLKKSTGEYVASNVRFNPKTLEATSFDWWYFVKRIGGKVVFNNYSYSSFTTRHQNKVSLLMKQLGIKVDVSIEAPKGLQDLEAARDAYEDRIRELIATIQKPGTRKDKNAWRATQVRECQKRVKEIQTLMKAEARHG